MKAIIKGTECCIKLDKFEDAIEWCKYGLLVNDFYIKKFFLK